MTQETVSPARELAGRVALVTGGAGGIGSAVARRLAQSGASVVIADSNLARASALAEDLSARGTAALAVQVDVADESSVAALVSAAEGRFGKVDLLVNAAGVQGVSADLGHAVCRVAAGARD